MKSLAKKISGSRAAANFLKASLLSVFGIANIKAEMSHEMIAGITVGVLFVGIIVAVIWGRMGSEKEA